MSFNEWVNELYGWEIDLCDLAEEDVTDLYAEYQKDAGQGTGEVSRLEPMFQNPNARDQEI